MFYATGDMIPGHGVVSMMTETGYRLDNGDFLPFTVAHPRPAASGLVVFADGTRYGGSR